MKPTPDIFHDGGGDGDRHSDGGDDGDEETLSLRDLPITVDYADQSTTKRNHSRQSSSSSSDSFFEFFNDASDVTSSTADDVILDGHILPYAPPTPHLPRRSLSLSAAATRSDSRADHHSVATRSESVELRQSRSLNCRKLRRSETKSEYSRSLSSSSSCRITPPWYHWLIFGLPVRIPAEIELKDMKNRQNQRRNLTPPPPSRFFSGDRRSSSSPSASWRVLSVLSCKNYNSVNVSNTPPPVFP